MPCVIFFVLLCHAHFLCVQVASYQGLITQHVRYWVVVDSLAFMHHSKNIISNHIQPVWRKKPSWPKSVVKGFEQSSNYWFKRRFFFPLLFFSNTSTGACTLSASASANGAALITSFTKRSITDEARSFPFIEIPFLFHLLTSHLWN